MFSAFERMVAFRYLRARRKEGFISVIAWFSLVGIALGVATLIIVMSVMNGFRAELLGRVLGLNGHMSVMAQQGTMPDYDRIAGLVRGVPGVQQAAPTIESQVMVTTQSAASGALVRGVKPDDLKARKLVADAIKEGTLDGFGQTESVVIGQNMARRLALRVGDQITLVSPQGNASPFGTMPRLKAFPVSAIFKVGMYEYDNTFIFMPLDAAQKFFRSPDAVNNIEVFMSDPDATRTVARGISDAVGPGYNIFDWRSNNAAFVGALETERNVMFLILTLIILVAAFNIISSLIMLVKDKGRDIAVLRAMGATRAMIVRIFFLSGVSVGLAGTVAGFVLGLAFTLNIESIRQGLQYLLGVKLFEQEIYFLATMPAKVEPSEVVTVVVMAVGLTILASIYPSWRAGRLDPAEALRYE